MRKFGLIGYPLSHSFSEKYFAQKFEREGITGCSYELFPLENIEDVRLLFEVQKDLRGLNVTIPYKESVIEYLDGLDPIAQKIGAVNCIRIDEIQRIGFNTDHAGFRDALKPLLLRQHTRALVLGTGGASKAVLYALQELGITTTIVSRTAGKYAISYADITAEMMRAHTLIINTTPLGMHPHVEDFPPLPYEHISPDHLLFDLIYNPAETVFMQKGRAQGAKVSNGYTMLQLQAEYAWDIWNEMEEDTEEGQTGVAE